MSTLISDPAVLREKLLLRATELGFETLGIASTNNHAEIEAGLRSYLSMGHHGTMGWMEREPGKRANPEQLWPAARSAIMLGTNYAPNTDPLAGLLQKSTGAVSAYASRRDYHDVIKGRLKQLAGWLVSKSGAEVKVFVDTAPLMEKPLAARAGIGWQGKHTNLVSPQWGSWLFLGAILTDMELPADEAQRDQCGSCSACLDICPTKAFPAPYKLDARKCLAYLTIEHDGPIDRVYRKPMANRIFGCDDCLAVCPWNKFAKAANDNALAAREQLAGMPLGELARLDDPAFRKLFAGTPVKRTGRDKFLRNVMIAIGNSDDQALLPSAVNGLDDEAPLVRAMAVWALKQLGDPNDIKALQAKHLPNEADEHVREEWLSDNG